MRRGVAALTLFFAAAAVVQHHDGYSPHAVLQQRSIRALGEQQIEDLRAGRGMGLALAAELNGDPDPQHVLELADQLHLAVEQRRRVQRLYELMKAKRSWSGRS